MKASLAENGRLAQRDRSSGLPQTARPDLTHEYTNLMYCCDPCNIYKGNRYPPANARADGHRFFRPDEDAFDDHFELSGIRLNSKSNVGAFSILALRLNRQGLTRLRALRARLANCVRFVAQGVLGLRNYRIDELPPGIKGHASTSIKRATEFVEQIGDSIDALLRDHARSPLIDPDSKSAEEDQQRAAELSGLQVMYGGNWRAVRKPRKRL